MRGGRERRERAACFFSLGPATPRDCRGPLRRVRAGTDPTSIRHRRLCGPKLSWRRRTHRGRGQSSIHARGTRLCDTATPAQPFFFVFLLARDQCLRRAVPSLAMQAALHPSCSSGCRPAASMRPALPARPAGRVAARPLGEVHFFCFFLRALRRSAAVSCSAAPAGVLDCPSRQERHRVRVHHHWTRLGVCDGVASLSLSWRLGHAPLLLGWADWDALPHTTSSTNSSIPEKKHRSAAAATPRRPCPPRPPPCQPHCSPRRAPCGPRSPPCWPPSDSTRRRRRPGSSRAWPPPGPRPPPPRLSSASSTRHPARTTRPTPTSARSTMPGPGTASWSTTGASTSTSGTTRPPSARRAT